MTLVEQNINSRVLNVVVSMLMSWRKKTSR